MTRKYYYNPDQGDSAPNNEMTFNRSEAINYISTHKFIRERLEKCSKQFNCKIPYLHATLKAIADSTHNFSCQASQKTLAEKAGMSVRTLQKCIYALREFDILTTRHRYTKGKNKRRTTSKTIIKAFLRFLDIQKYNAVKAKNFVMARASEIKGFIERSATRKTPKPTPSWDGLMPLVE